MIKTRPQSDNHSALELLICFAARRVNWHQTFRMGYLSGCFWQRLHAFGTMIHARHGGRTVDECCRHFKAATGEPCSRCVFYGNCVMASWQDVSRAIEVLFETKLLLVSVRSNESYPSALYCGNFDVGRAVNELTESRKRYANAPHPPAVIDCKDYYFACVTCREYATGGCDGRGSYGDLLTRKRDHAREEREKLTLAQYKAACEVAFSESAKAIETVLAESAEPVAVFGRRPMPIDMTEAD